ncbi:hypothetical protein CXG81DRAFT_18765 [Caulochytrium protostelioides]|uniref:Uncharacterized protein n=1 Tax=Caulochytrium protostelioides TaxID=1555241 RepID=A0A4P9X869_9FUNG|nr:hypothetical protein CXG81DRAFT_18765 [Caulochytrium protostelioides]|eukprot:RKP01445.1 hypothetical protein CXG81DRAFT_18765 [Caulochytrium protostelioides]
MLSSVKELSELLAQGEAAGTLPSLHGQGAALATGEVEPARGGGTTGFLPYAVEELDYDYIDRCTDARTLTNLLAVLRSGKEGYFPDLERHLVKRCDALSIKTPKVGRPLALPAAAAATVSTAAPDGDAVGADLDAWITQMADAPPAPRAAVKAAVGFDNEMTKGNEAFRRCEWADAHTAYTRSLKWQPRSARALSNRSAAAFQLAQYAAAEADADACLATGDAAFYVKARFRRGRAREALQRRAEAVADYDAVLAYDPDHAEAKKARHALVSGPPPEAAGATTKATTATAAQTTAVPAKTTTASLPVMTHRLQIQEVDEDDDDDDDEDGEAAAASRPEKSPSPSQGASTARPRPPMTTLLDFDDDAKLSALEALDLSSMTLTER